ncbi:hypothetical protein, partial [uncultured Chryseobacterium sp.]|uniref:hypothetical protein n=1 Tax=uncultured Chryseobacterium sp. TaxID=259322 RepID=UPI0025F2D3A8
MTKKMISWLAGMAVFLILSSCRNDIFPEKEALQNTGSFQLTSQRISLAESKHKLKLTPELSKAENFLKSLKTNVSGKTFSYGNGVSIDTDDVIYIENGPDYHTYIFHIKRENAPENAPLENLVLSPLSDGSYRELLFTYDLSSAEKQDIIQGIPVDTKGKVSVTELAKGTYNTGGQLARTTCNWQEKTVWVSCSEGLHDGSNFHQCYFVNHPSE